MCLANVILDIIDNGLLTSINPLLLEFANSKSGLVEILNIIIATHKKRYIQCYIETEKSSEVKNIVRDCRFIINENVMSDLLIEYIFKLSICKNYKSIEFREICVGIIEELPTCKIPEIKYTLLQKIIRYIIDFRLYIEDPFTSILRNASYELDSMKNEFGIITTQMFLE